AEDGIRDFHVTGVQTCALPISQCLRQNEWKPVRTRPGQRSRLSRLRHEEGRGVATSCAPGADPKGAGRGETACCRKSRRRESSRSEERRVGKERRSRRWQQDLK